MVTAAAQEGSPADATPTDPARIGGPRVGLDTSTHQEDAKEQKREGDRGGASCGGKGSHPLGGGSPSGKNGGGKGGDRSQSQWPRQDTGCMVTAIWAARGTDPTRFSGTGPKGWRPLHVEDAAALQGSFTKQEVIYLSDEHKVTYQMARQMMENNTVIASITKTKI